MITFQNVNKSFGNHYVLKNINIKFPRTGLIVIQGPSGCGKTTLLNLLSGLLSFDGDIEVDGHHLNLMNQNDLDEFRLKNYGFVFQDFKLFENENVINNIMFPMNVVTNTNREAKNQKCKTLISMVGLKKNIHQKVSKLSGGEKQRVAIARALVNNPKIILADEPTGALDTKTGHEIMNVLQTVSLRSLVIVVSHDEELAKEYADQIVRMSDGQIVEVIIQERKVASKTRPISKVRYSSRKPIMPTSFLFNHTLSSIKQKKWRTSVCNLVTSLGLIGVGLATSLSSAISSNIKKSYAQIIDDTKITMTIKNQERSIYGLYAASYYEAAELTLNYQEYIYDIGCTYYNDFESFFPHDNCIALADSPYYTPIEGISARHINEFRWLDIDHPDTIYPEDIDYLENDQVVLALTIDMIYDLCFELHLPRTVLSLSRYLQTNKLKMYFNLRNDNWQYDDQQLFEVCGFTLEKQPGIYHNNHMWNEYMFEERMRFPIDDKISTIGEYPWELKKIYYFYCYENYEEFLFKARQDIDFNPYILEIANETYYPWLMNETNENIGKRLLIFDNTMISIPMSYYPLFKNTDSQIESPVYGSYGGYSIYPSSMMYGFSNYMYFSNSKLAIEETIDITTTISKEINENIELPDNVLSGHYSQTMSGGVNFKTLNGELLSGDTPTDLSEIVISSGLEKKLFDGDAINKTLSVAYLYSESQNNQGDIERNYRTVDLLVVGVKEDEKSIIYHRDDWTITFFQVMLGVSAFNLQINSVMVYVEDEKNVEAVVKKLERAFPELDVYEPMSEINESINQVCGYIEIALMCFSIVAVVVSVLLLSICNHLYLLENKKDIGLVRCIGVSKKEAKKLIVTHSVVMCFISFALSSIELFMSSILISFELSKQMETAFELSFNPLALLYMFLLAFGISIMSSLIIASRVNKLDPLSALKS